MFYYRCRQKENDSCLTGDILNILTGPAVYYLFNPIFDDSLVIFDSASRFLRMPHRYLSGIEWSVRPGED